MQSKLRRKLSVVHGSRHGFSLIEVLVVLAILVILFGLLFAPMMAGIDMAASGRSQARLQDTVRLAAEQMRRELANAVYVYPPPTYTTLAGPPVTDYSQLVFVPAAAGSQGPKQPRTWTGVSGRPEYFVTRYYVRPPAAVSTGMDLGYDSKNPFVLVRQQGLYRFNAALGRFQFGSEKSDGTLSEGVAMSENVITPSEEYDLPASSTICRVCGQMEVGYVSVCTKAVHPVPDLVYLHDGVSFRPERITGEALAPSENNTLYTARHGNWMGTVNNGTVPLGSTSLSATAPELQPRIVDYRWEGSGYERMALDSFTPEGAVPALRSSIALRWNST
ncbi:MAG: prepilin-type N-terminal cleavage/methylation domain-containing protein, partial [Armatimonadota bacterium]